MKKRYEVEGDWAALGKYFFYGHVTWYGVYPVFSFLVPYLLRTLGPANYGAIAFMQGIAAYYNLFIDFGFNLTAPRKLARSPVEGIPHIFSIFMWSKVLLLVIVTVAFWYSPMGEQIELVLFH